MIGDVGVGERAQLVVSALRSIGGSITVEPGAYLSTPLLYSREIQVEQTRHRPALPTPLVPHLSLASTPSI
jgi:hypothetical protein